MSAETRSHPPRTKNSVYDFAILGAAPLFASPLHVGRPNVCNRETMLRYINEAVERLWLTNDGPLLLEMESRFAQFLGVKHCLAVANATLGLLLVAEALALEGTVLMPSLTFIATARAMEWRRLRPKFCDVSTDRMSLDPEEVRRAMSPDVSAILGVHLWGIPCEVNRLQMIADQHGVPLLFDAAHAFGSNHEGRMVGGFGRAEVFSLHATKVINALEGGLVATNDDDLAQRIKATRNFGFVGEDQVSGSGINAKMNEFSAAMALSNLDGFPTLLEHNRKIQRAYVEGIGELPGVEMVSARFSDSHNAHYAVLRVSSLSPLSRDELLAILRAENVVARRYFWPGCHRCSPFNESASGAEALPVTERLLGELLQLPTGLQLDADAAFSMGRLVALAIQHAPRLRRSIPCLET